MVSRCSIGVLEALSRCPPRCSRGGPEGATLGGPASERWPLSRSTPSRRAEPEPERPEAEVTAAHGPRVTGSMERPRALGRVLSTCQAAPWTGGALQVGRATKGRGTCCYDRGVGHYFLDRVGGRYLGRSTCIRKRGRCWLHPRVCPIQGCGRRWSRSTMCHKGGWNSDVLARGDSRDRGS